MKGLHLKAIVLWPSTLLPLCVLRPSSFAATMDGPSRPLHLNSMQGMALLQEVLPLAFHPFESMATTWPPFILPLPSLASSAWMVSPVLMELMTYRRGHHSTSDDAGRYRDSGQVTRMARHGLEPISRAKLLLKEAGTWDDQKDEEFREQIRVEVMDALRTAEAKPLCTGEGYV